MGAFAADTAHYYARFRRGYPDVVIEAIADRLRLGRNDAVVDLGCGTGLLTRPIARRTRIAVGVDPEPEMLAVARETTGNDLGSRVAWLLGSDSDLPALRSLFGSKALSAITIGQALHFMDYTRLFRQAEPLLRPGGGIAVVANGVPLWQQDEAWSDALRSAIEEWFRIEATAPCGTDAATQQRYAAALAEQGYETSRFDHEYQAWLSLEEVLGGLYSAVSEQDLPAANRDAFAEHVRRALAPWSRFREVVPVRALIGVAP